MKKSMTSKGSFWQKALLMFSALALGVGAACSSPRLGSVASETPKASAGDAGTALRDKERETDRKIAPSDLLSIEVYGDKDLTVERRVEQSGFISYPLLTNVEVANKTTVQVAELLTQMLADGYLRKPHVTVTVKEYRSRTVSVMGAVQRPGAYELPKETRLDILEAISMASGLQQIGNKNKIEHTRNGVTTKHRFDDLREEMDNSRLKVWLEPGDKIYVPEAIF